MDHETPLIIIQEHGDDLAQAGLIADHYANQDVLTDYQKTTSANTKRRQKSEMRAFSRYLAAANVSRSGEALSTDITSWRGITSGILKGYKNWQLHQGVAIGTLNIRLATLKRYCALAYDAGMISSDEYARIDQVRGFSHHEGKNVDQERTTTRIGAKKAEPTVISAAHAKRFKQQPDTKKGRRDALLLCFMLDHGFRCSEIAALKVAKLDVGEATMTMYREKVHLWQVHDLSPDTLQAAQAYLPYVGDQVWLFPGNRDRETGETGPLTTRAINDRIFTLGQRIGIKERFGPHDGRHHWTTDIFKNGTSIDRVQEAGGWSSPAMPLRYANKGRKANEGVKITL